MNERVAEVLEELRRVAADELSIDAAFDLSTPLHDGIPLDSMSALVVTVALEDRFRVALDEVNVGALHTVGDLVALVCRRIDEQSTGVHP